MSKPARQPIWQRRSCNDALTKRDRTILVWRVTFSLFFLWCLPWLSHVSASEESRWGAIATQPVPEDAKVTIEFDQREFYLGENVLVHFILKNMGDQPFEASFGGDYRGSSRRLRFKVTATDEAGRIAEDPDPFPVCFGGLGGSRTLKPGEEFITSLPLMRYCRTVQPGRYIIRVTHDFGWKEGKLKRPVAEATITFRMPDTAEAERVITEMEKLPEDPNATFGQRSRYYANFSCLQQPVYLEPLLRRARTGNRHALQGIGSIATPESTEALIEVADSTDTKLALDAALTLNARLPDPEFESKLPGRGPFRFDALEARRRLAAKSWDTKFAPKVRTLATKFLAGKETREIGCGAFMIQTVGTVTEAPAVIATMDRVLEPMVNPRHDPKDNILNFPEPLSELLRAMLALRSRGFALSESLSGHAQILLYFDWLADKPPPRPPQWMERINAFGTDSRYPIREAALRSIPQPLSTSCTEFVQGRLADCDLGVCRVACIAAGKSGNREFLKPLLEIIATEHHEWLLREASNAAHALGAGFDLLEAWANRLNEEHLYGLALESLATIIRGLPSGYSGRTDLTRAERLELQKQWKEFLTNHADEIRQGKCFKITDPLVRPELFGRARVWQLPDGTSWPKPTETPKGN